MTTITVGGAGAAPANESWWEGAGAAAPRWRQVGEALARQKWLALAVVGTFAAVAAALSLLIRPYYVADASLIIAPANLHWAELTPASYPPPMDLDRELQTQLTILGSRSVAVPVIAELNLETRDPEIAAALGGLERQLAKKGWHLSAATRAQVADGVFANQLKLLPDKISSTVHVQFGSRDAALAAEVANAITREFVRQTLDARAGEAAAAALWMRQQLAGAQTELAGDEAAVERFQRDNAYAPLAAGDAPDPLLARLADANHDLSAATSARMASQALVDSYSGGVVAALPAELRNPAIDRAVENVGAAEAELSALASTYHADFPLVVEARARLGDAQQKLAGLREQVSAGLRQRLAADAERERQARQLVEELNRQAAARSALGIQYSILTERAAAQRTLYQNLRQKLSEVELTASQPPGNIRLLDAAAPPLLPAYPRLPLDLGLALGLGLAAAVGVVLARERWHPVLRDGDEVMRGLGAALAPLGMVPDHRLALAGPSGRALLPAQANSAPLESYARIAANLVARCGPPPRAVLLTSANAGEGKTVTSCQLGLALAGAGWRTLLVDADLRRPGCHSYFGLDNQVGLRAAERDPAVAPQTVTADLDLMPCEVGGALPLQARAMARLLDTWREHYDYILLDSPPGNLTGEAVALSRLVEAVLVVLGWGQTRLPEAQQLCAEMARAQAPLAGTIFNRTDPRAPAYRYYRRAQSYALSLSLQS